MDLLAAEPACTRAPGASRRRRLLALVALLGLTLPSLIGATVTFAGDQLSREHGIKAAFLYNFAKFIKWPAEIEASQAPFVVCLLGRPSFADAMHTIEGKSIRGKRLVVRDVTEDSALEGCRLVFFSADHARRIDIYAARTSTLAVLTVADTPEFAGAGGAIGYYIENDKVRFAIDTEVTKRHGLSVSSRLLKVAGRIVR